MELLKFKNIMMVILFSIFLFSTNMTYASGINENLTIYSSLITPDPRVHLIKIDPVLENASNYWFILTANDY
jgi:hypothetical protein